MVKPQSNWTWSGSETLFGEEGRGREVLFLHKPLIHLCCHLSICLVSIHTCIQYTTCNCIICSNWILLQIWTLKIKLNSVSTHIYKVKTYIYLSCTVAKKAFMHINSDFWKFNINDELFCMMHARVSKYIQRTSVIQFLMCSISLCTFAHFISLLSSRFTLRRPLGGCNLTPLPVLWLHKPSRQHTRQC